MLRLEVQCITLDLVARIWSGLASYADSMAAIKLVFEDKVYLRRQSKALVADFERIWSSESRLAAPKYGNDDDYVWLLHFWYYWGVQKKEHQKIQEPCIQFWVTVPCQFQTTLRLDLQEHLLRTSCVNAFIRWYFTRPWYGYKRPNCLYQVSI